MTNQVCRSHTVVQGYEAALELELDTPDIYRLALINAILISRQMEPAVFDGE